MSKIYKIPRFMRLYKELDVEESCFHSGFLYGFLMFFIASISFTRNLYYHLGLFFGYLLFDQIIYRIWLKIYKHRGRC